MPETFLGSEISLLNKTGTISALMQFTFCAVKQIIHK